MIPPEHKFLRSPEHSVKTVNDLKNWCCTNTNEFEESPDYDQRHRNDILNKPFNDDLEIHMDYVKAVLNYEVNEDVVITEEGTRL